MARDPLVVLLMVLPGIMLAVAFKNRRLRLQTLHTESNLPDRPVPYSMCSNTLYYQWKSPRNSITIRLSLDVVRRLSLVVEGGFRALRTRGLEVGGLLLGPFTPGHGRITVIDDFEPIDSEHRSGPSYLLSERDKGQLENKLAHFVGASTVFAWLATGEVIPARDCIWTKRIIQLSGLTLPIRLRSFWR